MGVDARPRWEHLEGPPVGAQAAEARGTLVFFHGGYWRALSRDLFHWVRNNHQSDLHHSDDLSEDGRAFAEAVAALRVARRLLRGF